MAVDLDDAKLKRDSLFFWRPPRIVSMADVSAMDAEEWSEVYHTDVVEHLLARFIARSELEN
jgi:hypothetical protein